MEEEGKKLESCKYQIDFVDGGFKSLRLPPASRKISHTETAARLANAEHVLESDSFNIFYFLSFHHYEQLFTEYYQWPPKTERQVGFFFFHHLL